MGYDEAPRFETFRRAFALLQQFGRERAAWPREILTL
jgi:hypothetical protein